MSRLCALSTCCRSAIIATGILSILVLRVEAGIRSDALCEYMNAIQVEHMNCGPKALCFSLRALGHSVDCNELAEQIDIDSKGVSLLDLLKLAQRYHSTARAIQIPPTHVDRLPAPAILVTGDVHCVVYCGQNDGLLTIYDPVDRQRSKLSRDELSRHWNGKTIVFTETASDWGRYLVSPLIPAIALLAVALNLLFTRIRFRKEDRTGELESE